jgi:hypothetical protein
MRMIVRMANLVRQRVPGGAPMREKDRHPPPECSISTILVVMVAMRMGTRKAWIMPMPESSAARSLMRLAPKLPMLKRQSRKSIPRTMGAILRWRSLRNSMAIIGVAPVR